MNLNLKELIERVKVWAQKDAIKNIWEDKTGRSVPVMTNSAIKYDTTCCAMMIVSAKNDTSLVELIYILERARAEMGLRWSPKSRCSGETYIQIVTSPGENELEEKLKQLNFSLLTMFSRRNGYPEGKLKLWGLDLTK